LNPNGIHRSIPCRITGEPARHPGCCEEGDYIGARQVRFSVFPGSALAKKQPAEVMSAEP
jgi:ATP-dependent helicase HrpA